MPEAFLKGAIRLIIAANNNRVLDGIEEMSEADRDALAKRLIYVQVGSGPRAFLEALSRDERTAWADYQIAEHALWLRANRQVKPGARFLVEGRTSEMHDRLSVQSGLAPAICEFLVGRIATSTPALANALKENLRIGNGQIWCTAKAFQDEATWKLLVPGTNYPSTSMIYRTLSNLRTRQVTGLAADGSKTIFNSIRVDLLTTWVYGNGAMDVDVLKRRIEASNANMIEV
jgi:hypothetical protein